MWFGDCVIFVGNRVVERRQTVDEALEIKNTDIVDELQLPPVKIHCSVLAEDAYRAALQDVKDKADKEEV